MLHILPWLHAMVLCLSALLASVPIFASELVPEPPVALITGSSYGLGKELTERAVAKGWRVALVDIRPEPSLLMIDAIRERGGEAIFYPIDLAEPSQRSGLVSKVLNTYGRIDYLFNNAGYAYLATLEQMTAVDAKHLFEVNYWAYADLAQQVIPVMRAQGSGTIVNVSSILGMRAAPAGFGHYSATKHALHGLFQAVMAEVTNDNIKVLIAAPGGMRTHVGQHSVGPLVEPGSDRAAQWEDPAIAANDIFNALADPSGIFNPGAVGRRMQAQ